MKTISQSANTLYIPFTDADHTRLTECRHTTLTDSPKLLDLELIPRWRQHEHDPEQLIKGAATFTLRVAVVDESNCGVSPNRFLVGGIICEIEGNARVILLDSDDKPYLDPIGLRPGTYISVFIDTNAHEGCLVGYLNRTEGVRVNLRTPEVFEGMIAEPGIPLYCRAEVDEDVLLAKTPPTSSTIPGFASGSLGDDDE